MLTAENQLFLYLSQFLGIGLAAQSVGQMFRHLGKVVIGHGAVQGEMLLLGQAIPGGASPERKGFQGDLTHHTDMTWVTGE